MRVLLQRVKGASVTVEGLEKGKIEQGLLLLVGIEQNDDLEDIEWLAKKITSLRIFNDENRKMNLSLTNINGEILSVSQFTLHASTKKGNRPSFIKAAKPDFANSMYELFNQKLSKIIGKDVSTGKFGANMEIKLTNDGPVSIWLDSKNKE